MAGESEPNSRWHHYNDGNTVFVFIHGFFSNNKKCWTNADGTYWPDLIFTDPRLNNPAIFMAGYYTDIDSGSYKVSDCANEILADLCRPGIKGEQAALDKKNIVFVCHSLGGIVARYMIERNREKFIDKAIGLILMASPSYGSDYANKFKKLISFYKNRVAAQLQYANGSLQDLDDRFRSLVQQKTIARMIGAEATEHHFLFHCKYLPGFAPVVEKESAARYFGAGHILPNTNHSTCVKPDTHDHVAHKFLTSTYLNLFLPIAYPAEQVPRDDSTGRQDPNPLFEIYEKTDESFYLKRKIDEELHHKAKLFSVWLYGSSGVGKTACTRRRAFQEAKLPLQVYIGALAGTEVDHVTLLNEIYFTVCGVVNAEFESLDSSHKIVEEIGAMLVSRGISAGVVLVIDEIPLLKNPSFELPKFLFSIISLISVVKRLSGVSHAGVILNSIFDPVQYIDDPSLKIAEQIKFVQCVGWTEDELNSLIERILIGLNVEIDLADRKDLIAKSSGSPRFVKNFFKEINLSK